MLISFEGKQYSVDEGITVSEVLSRFNTEPQQPPRVLLRRKIMGEKPGAGYMDPPVPYVMYVDEKFIDAKDYTRTKVAENSEVEPLFYEDGG